jgi:drug/metabolite transporter (DMT)-like permease
VNRARPGLGIALILVMAACFAALDSAVKWLGAALPVLLVLWLRYAIQAAVMVVWLAITRRRGGAGFATAHPRFQTARGALLLTTSALSFWGVQLMPMAEFTALILLTPLLVTMLAGLVLGERVSRLRWAVVAGGFIGALVVVRPGTGVLGIEAALPLAAALSYAVFQVLTSRLSTLDNPYTTHFWTGFVGAGLLAPVLLGWIVVGGIDVAGQLSDAGPVVWTWLLLAGLFGTAGHLCLILALGMAPAATLMPFVYVQILFAGAIGWVVFDHLPDGTALVGMAMVAACGAAGAWLNLRPASVPRPAPVTLAGTLGD